jgi:hypothetical protein
MDKTGVTLFVLLFKDFVNEIAFLNTPLSVIA